MMDRTPKPILDESSEFKLNRTPTVTRVTFTKLGKSYTFYFDMSLPNYKTIDKHEMFSRIADFLSFNHNKCYVAHCDSEKSRLGIISRHSGLSFVNLLSASLDEIIAKTEPFNGSQFAHSGALPASKVSKYTDRKLLVLLEDQIKSANRLLEQKLREEKQKELQDFYAGNKVIELPSLQYPTLDLASYDKCSFGEILSGLQSDEFDFSSINAALFDAQRKLKIYYDEIEKISSHVLEPEKIDGVKKTLAQVIRSIDEFSWDGKDRFEIIEKEHEATNTSNFFTKYIEYKQLVNQFAYIKNLILFAARSAAVKRFQDIVASKNKESIERDLSTFNTNFSSIAYFDKDSVSFKFNPAHEDTFEKAEDPNEVMVILRQIIDDLRPYSYAMKYFREELKNIAANAPFGLTMHFLLNPIQIIIFDLGKFSHVELKAQAEYRKALINKIFREKLPNSQIDKDKEFISVIHLQSINPLEFIALDFSKISHLKLEAQRSFLEAINQFHAQQNLEVVLSVAEDTLAVAARKDRIIHLHQENEELEKELLKFSSTIEHFVAQGKAILAEFSDLHVNIKQKENEIRSNALQASTFTGKGIKALTIAITQLEEVSRDQSTSQVNEVDIIESKNRRLTTIKNVAKNLNSLLVDATQDLDTHRKRLEEISQLIIAERVEQEQQKIIHDSKQARFKEELQPKIKKLIETFEPFYSQLNAANTNYDEKTCRKINNFKQKIEQLRKQNNADYYADQKAVGTLLSQMEGLATYLAELQASIEKRLNKKEKKAETTQKIVEVTKEIAKISLNNILHPKRKITTPTASTSEILTRAKFQKVDMENTKLAINQVLGDLQNQGTHQEVETPLDRPVLAEDETILTDNEMTLEVDPIRPAIEPSREASKESKIIRTLGMLIGGCLGALLGTLLGFLLAPITFGASIPAGAVMGGYFGCKLGSKASSEIRGSSKKAAIEPHSQDKTPLPLSSKSILAKTRPINIPKEDITTSHSCMKIDSRDQRFSIETPKAKEATIDPPLFDNYSFPEKKPLIDKRRHKTGSSPRGLKTFETVVGFDLPPSDNDSPDLARRNPQKRELIFGS